jgi:hypothetical protein
VEGFPEVGWEEFRYVNDGVIWGDPAILRELAAEYLTHCPVVNQAYFNHRYVFENATGRTRLQIDKRAHHALNLMMVQLRYFEMRGKRPHYVPTDSTPVVLHAPGAYGTYSIKGEAVPMPKQLEDLYVV